MSITTVAVCVRRATFALASGLALACPASGQTTFQWTTPGGGIFQDLFNWHPFPGGPPGAMDTALFDLNASYTVSFNGSATSQFLVADAGDVLLALQGSTYALVGGYPTFIVGNSVGSQAAIALMDGTLTSESTLVGANFGSVAEVNLLSSSTWTNQSAIYIGSFGNGHVAAASGAQVSCLWTEVGGEAGSVGTLELADAGTLWNCSGSIMAVGADGSGTLAVTGGATLLSLWGEVASTAIAIGHATVHGRGSQWNMPDSVTKIGMGGHGTLVIDNGGSVESGYLAVIGELPGSIGDVTVASGGNDASTWSIDGSMVVGAEGHGELTVADGGSVASSIAVVGEFSGGNGQVIVEGAGSSLSVVDYVELARAGTATLNVVDGATFTGQRLYSGSQPGAVGVALFDGAGTSVQFSGDDSFISVATEGSATLAVSGGATVSVLGGANNTSGFLLVAGVGGTGTVNIAGGAEVTTSAQTQIGTTGGDGELTIASGAKLFSHKAQSPSGSSGIIGSSAGATGVVSVTAAGSRWENVDGILSVGFNDDGTGVLNVTGGGTVTSVGGFVGRFAGSDGDVHIANPGANWTSSAAVVIGDSGTGSLEVRDGGVLAAPSIVVGPNGVVTGDATLSGAVFNNGMIAPGTSTDATRTLTVGGTYTQGRGGRLAIDVGGTAAGQFDSVVGGGGVFNLGGTLEIALVNGFQPSGGQTIVIMAGGVMLGTFDEVLSPVPVTVTPGETIVLVTFCAFADLNCDGLVNGADLGILLGSWGPCADCDDCPAALDGDCDVDGGDLGLMLGSWT